MKRLLFFSILVTLLCGCNPAGNKGQDSVTDSIGVVSNDTIALEVPEDPVPEPIPEPEPPFTSPDLKFNRLQGHVKQVEETAFVTSYNDKETSHSVSLFSKEGVWILDKGIEIKRNKKGQIIQMVEYEDDEFPWISESKYNSDGYVYYETLNIDYEDFLYFQYQLNDNGWIVSSKCRKEEVGGGVYARYTEKYNYSNIDDHGNWLKCVVTRKNEAVFDEDKPFTEKDVFTRKITYWE